MGASITFRLCRALSGTEGIAFRTWHTIHGIYLLLPKAEVLAPIHFGLVLSLMMQGRNITISVTPYSGRAGYDVGSKVPEIPGDRSI